MTAETDGARRRSGFGPGWRMLAQDLRAVRGPAVRVLAWSAVQGLPALISGRVLAEALNHGFLAHRPLIGLLWLLALGASLLLGAAANRAMFPALAETVEPLRDILVTRLTGAVVRDAAAGEDVPDTAAVARLTGQVETVRGLVGAILRSARPSAVNFAAALTGLLTLAPGAALFVLAPLVGSAVLFVASLRSLAQRRREVVLLDESIAAESGAVLNAVRDIVACNAQARACARLDAQIGAQSAATVRLAWSEALRTLTVSLGGELPLVGLLVAGGWLVHEGRLDPDQLIGAVTYVTAGMIPALQSLVTVATTWGVQLGTVLQRIREATAPKSPAPAPAVDGSARPDGYRVSVRGLEFRYGVGADPVIEKLDLDIREGGHLAVIGPSGVGKSTLTRLLTGALPPDRGEVRLGGVPVRELDERVLHRIQAIIPQEAYVFAGTIRENLVYLCPGADDRRVSAAAEATGLTDLLDRLGGLDAAVGPGAAVLSAGEAQLMATTRVLLSPADVVILDEATCHLDPAAEARVEQAFAARPGTLIVIAHRISSAQRADRILLLDGTGAVIGTPDELSTRSPLYAELLGYWQPNAGGE